jgi:hypothetical protein
VKPRKLSKARFRKRRPHLLPPLTDAEFMRLQREMWDAYAAKERFVTENIFGMLSRTAP